MKQKGWVKVTKGVWAKKGCRLIPLPSSVHSLLRCCRFITVIHWTLVVENLHYFRALPLAVISAYGRVVYAWQTIWDGSQIVGMTNIGVTPLAVTWTHGLLHTGSLASLTEKRHLESTEIHKDTYILYTFIFTKFLFL